ncbi:MAG: hypothetical protein HC858_03095 [Brachymonas sp.]|nr:hypothetical protein [Brachymonas sp.]
MLKVHQIVGVGLLALLGAGCGQKGPLTQPTDAAAQNRATLPQVLNPSRPASSPQTPSSATSSTPASPASAPSR